MRAISAISVLLVLLSGYSIAQGSLADYEKYWPQWRGPSASGVAPTGNPPAEWNENLNIRWKAEVPGIGHANPIIWEDQIILFEYGR